MIGPKTRTGGSGLTAHIVRGDEHLPQRLAVFTRLEGPCHCRNVELWTWQETISVLLRRRQDAAVRSGRMISYEESCRARS